MASVTKKRKRDKTIAAWLVHMVESHIAVQEVKGPDQHSESWKKNTKENVLLKLIIIFVNG